MADSSLLVFPEDGTIMILVGVSVLPEVLQSLPSIYRDDSGAEVRLTNVIQNEKVRAVMCTCIYDVLDDISQYGRIRLEFPSWDMMIVYAVDQETDAANEEPWDRDEVIKNFLDQRGPEMIL